MFGSLIREASADPNNFNQDGKIAALENEFGHDPIALKVAYMIATSHEYSTPNVAAAIAFVKDYDWEQSSWRVDGLQGIDKPINEAKVKEIANTIREKGNDFPLVTVDKFHGITPQTPGKLLLMDGHHRKHGLEEAGHETTPIYKGTYKGHDRLNEASDIVLEAFFGKKKEIPEEFYTASISLIRGIEEKLHHNPVVNARGIDYVKIVNEAKKKNKPAVMVKFNENLMFMSHGPEAFSAAVEAEEKAVKDTLKSQGYTFTVEENPWRFHITSTKNSAITGTIFLTALNHSVHMHYKSSAINESHELYDHLHYISEAAKRKKPIEKLPLTGDEQAAVAAKYGQTECSFHKNAATGKYFCMTHRYKSDEFDSPTDIPVSDVQFVSRTS